MKNTKRSKNGNENNERTNVRKGNNKLILDYFASRLDLGNIKFGDEMPIDGKYNEEDALEEAIDLAAYLISKLFYIRNKNNCKLCKSNPCVCVKNHKKTKKEVDKKIHDNSVIWWIDLFTTEIDRLQQRITALQDRSHDPVPVYPPEKGEELEARIKELEKKIATSIWRKVLQCINNPRFITAWQKIMKKK